MKEGNLSRIRIWLQIENWGEEKKEKKRKKKKGKDKRKESKIRV